VFTVTVAGADLALLPTGAAYLPAHRTLLVADAHFGKAQSFRRLGVPVPESTTRETLDGLARAVRQTQARRIVFLGDLLHARHGRSDRLFQALDAWRADHAALTLTLVRGNHDDRAGDPPPSLGFEVVDEPVSLGPFALCHLPRPVHEAYVIAGHWHPCVSVGRGFDRLRLPCFWFGAHVGVLPAFGSFTGMHPIARRPGDRVYAVAGDEVRGVPEV
jgi:uncharacterized protein